MSHAFQLPPVLTSYTTVGQYENQKIDIGSTILMADFKVWAGGKLPTPPGNSPH